MSDVKKLNDENLAEFKESKELKEDELDKVFGGIGIIAGRYCPNCGQEKLFDNGSVIICINCCYREGS